jgi:hypothetical protein
MIITSKADGSESNLAALTLGDLLAFNRHLAKLVDAGVPIRFPGAPSSLTHWLEGVNQRVSARVESGEAAACAVANDPHSNAAYRAALSAWLSSQLNHTADAQPQPQSHQHDLRVLEPWVQAGLRGDREVDRSAVFAFWLWIIGLLASVSMIFSVGRIFPKLQQFYENSGYERGIGYLGCEWIYDRLGTVAILLAGSLVAAPVLWWFWFQRIAKYRTLSSQLRVLFFAAYLVVGGAMVLAVGSIVFWPITELLMQVGEPRP